MLDLTIKPAQTELVAKPGVTITQAYTITNNSDTSVVLTTEVLPWKPSGIDGSVSYDNIKPNQNLEFSLANADLALFQKFTLLPGSSRQLVLKIKSTANIPLADSYYTFFVSQDLSNTINSDAFQSAATARIGSHILLSTSTSESIPSQLTVSNFNISPNIKDVFFPRIHFNAQINNSSSYYSKPEGKLTISKNNLVVKEFDIFPNNVLGQSSRNLLCNQNNEPVPCTISPPFWPGQYVATISLPTSTVSLTFFVFPYSILFLATFFGVILYKLLTRRNQISH